MISNSLIDMLSCPDCYGSLSGQNSNLECNKCDNNIPIIDGIPRFDKINMDRLIDYDAVKSVNPKNWTVWRKYNYEYIEKKLQNVNKSALLFDIGAGTQPFAELLGHFNTYTVDFNPYKGIDVVTDLNNPLPVRDSVVDIVVMSNLIEHIPEPLALLKESKRILKPGGTLILTVPFLIKIHQEPYDFFRYTEFMLQRLFNHSGFQNIEITKIGNLLDIFPALSNATWKLLHKTRNPDKYDLCNRGFNLALKVFKCIHLLIYGIMIKASGIDKHHVDEAGYPWGYGCVAK